MSRPEFKRDPYTELKNAFEGLFANNISVFTGYSQAFAHNKLHQMLKIIILSLCYMIFNASLCATIYCLYISFIYSFCTVHN